jgi:hypothetical protein
MLQGCIFDPDRHTKLARIAEVDGDDGLPWLFFVSRDPPVDLFDRLHHGGFVGACRPSKNEDRECRCHPALLKHGCRAPRWGTVGHNLSIVLTSR